MRQYRRREEEEQGSASWLLTFSDLLLLLLTTFVLKLSMASLESQNLASGLGMTLERSVQIQEASLQLAKILKKRLSEAMGPPTPLPGEKAGLRFAEEVTLMLVDRGVAISLGGGRFVPGKRELSPETADFLALLVQALKESTVFIRIEGHTDSTPIATTEFPSNWELSAARAISVGQFLVSQGIAGSSITAVGYSDTRPVADNFSEVARAKNRR